MSESEKDKPAKTAKHSGRFKKGETKPEKSGRKKGVQNKLTQSAKQAFQFAFDELGGAKGLAQWGKKNKDEFYKLYSKLIPVDVTTNGKSIIYEIVIGKKEN
jgi:hypothetical protein